MDEEVGLQQPSHLVPLLSEFPCAERSKAFSIPPDDRNMELTLQPDCVFKHLPEEDLTKGDDNSVFPSSAAVIAGANFLVGNSLYMLPQCAPIPNSILRYLIMSIAIAFLSALLSLRFHQKKAAALFRYPSLAFTTSTSAVLCYYLLISPLWSSFTSRPDR